MAEKIFLSFFLSFPPRVPFLSLYLTHDQATWACSYHRQVAHAAPTSPPAAETSPPIVMANDVQDSGYNNRVVVANLWLPRAFLDDLTIGSLGIHGPSTRLELLYKPMPKSPVKLHVLQWPLWCNLSL